MRSSKSEEMAEGRLSPGNVPRSCRPVCKENHLCGGLPDRQQGDHQLPRVVVERATELGDQQAAEGVRR